MRDHLMQLVPGGPSPLAEEVAAQGAAAGQLKHNLTQIAMDVVSLHKGLSVGGGLCRGTGACLAVLVVQTHKQHWCLLVTY